MRQSKVKAIRRVLRTAAINQDGPKFITHAKSLKSPLGEPFLRYTFQYVSNRYKNLLKFAKRVYKQTGILPRGKGDFS